jgi:hypothetical protein
MALFYTFPFLDASDFDGEIGERIRDFFNFLSLPSSGY